MDDLKLEESRRQNAAGPPLDEMNAALDRIEAQLTEDADDGEFPSPGAWPSWPVEAKTDLEAFKRLRRDAARLDAAMAALVTAVMHMGASEAVARREANRAVEGWMRTPDEAGARARDAAAGGEAT